MSELTPAVLARWREEAEARERRGSFTAARLIHAIDEITALRARIATLEPFGPNTHAGVWISRETSDKISKDGP